MYIRNGNVQNFIARPESAKIVPKSTPGRLVLRTALRNPYSVWPNGKVPLTISSRFSKRQRTIIGAGIKEFEKYTCVDFVKRIKQRNYVHIFKGDGCYAEVGRIGGKQTVSLGHFCTTKGVVVHELMHVLGFVHEQSRPDRDKYVTIKWKNIIPDAEDQFGKYSPRSVTDLGMPYDYASILHYSKRAFSRNGRPTVVPHDKDATIGQRRGFSRTDIKKINKLYNCPHKVPTDTTQNLHSNRRATVGKRDRTFIFTPNKQGRITLIRKPTGKQQCVDRRANCRKFLRTCSTAKSKYYCKKTCGICR